MSPTDEAHWSSGPTLTAAAPTETSKEIVCSVCANPQPRFQWTFNNETLRKGINETGDRIVLDVVGTEDYGVYQCTASNNINGENKMVTFDVKLVESGKFEWIHLVNTSYTINIVIEEHA